MENQSKEKYFHRCIKTEKQAILWPVPKKKINTYPPLFGTLFAAPVETAGGVLFWMKIRKKEKIKGRERGKNFYIQNIWMEKLDKARGKDYYQKQQYSYENYMIQDIKTK